MAKTTAHIGTKDNIVLYVSAEAAVITRFVVKN